MRAPLVAHPTVEGARQGGPPLSPWFVTLDGTWRFTLLAAPDDVSPRHVDGPTDGWAPIEVPGHWTLQGWDRPHYTNVQMPFPQLPPEVPEENPTGVYRTTFTVPEVWRERSVILHVGAAETVLYVFVNGWLAGSSTDSRLAAEFDITPFIHDDLNDLALVVVRWGAASHVEDQDHWWMAGLHRSVHLEGRAAVHIGHVQTRAGADGQLDVRVRLRTHGARLVAGWRARVLLEELDGTPVGALDAEVPSDVRPYRFKGYVAEGRLSVEGVRRWSAEDPHRYRLLVTLVDPYGGDVESVALFVGFRSVMVAEGLLQVNGTPVTVRGVNRHDHHPDRGKAVTEADMREDLLAMKRHNVNAVRTSHYPNDPVFLDLCDELGFYVIDEANLESHAWNELLSHDPAYRGAFVERVTRMVERDENHPCVVAWSLGNESGYGEHHDAAAAWVRRYDPTRPLHYEGAVLVDGWDGGRRATDLVCPMYPKLADIVAWAESGRHDRPMVLCEYSHAMGNSNGALADHWVAFDEHEQLQGGFIWEWKDHGLRQRLPDGRERFAYGGQFGDEPNDGNFVADGLMAPDLTPHPALREVAWVHRPVAVRRAADGALDITNRQDMSDLTALVARWELLVDGLATMAGELDVPPVPARASVRVPLPVEPPASVSPVTLVVRWFRRDATAWAGRSHLVAWDQVVLTEPPARRPPAARGSGRPSGDAVILEGDGVEAVVQDGRLTDLRLGQRSLLAAPMELTLWRAPTDNDGFKLLGDARSPKKPLGRWLAAGLDAMKDVVLGTDLSGGAVTIVRELHGANAAVHHRQQLELAGRTLIITDEVVVPDALDDLPRLGHRFQVPGALGSVRWFARGPHETYPDRAAAGIEHEWVGSPDELPYLVPQEFGLRVGVRRLVLGSPAGPALMIEAGEPATLMASVTHHTAEDLYAAADVLELRRRPEIVVHVDVAHRGVGTGSCGEDTLPQYRVGAGTYRWWWTLTPLSSP